MNRNSDNKNFSSIVLIIMVSIVFFPVNVPCQRVKEIYPDFKEDYFGQEPPGLSPRLFAPGIISTGMHEHSSVLYTQDMKDAFFTVAEGTSHVILHMKREKGKWSRPEIAPFSGIYSDDFLFFSADEKRLYFESKRPIARTKKEPEDKYNIWYVEKQDNQWSKPVYDPVLSGLEMSTACFARNRDLYFGSSKPQGKGGMDIYVARWGKGTYKEVENLGDAVNSPHMEYGVFVDPDEQYLIYTLVHNIHRVLIHMKQDKNNRWSAPETVSFSGFYDDCLPFFSNDGKVLYFISRRPLDNTHSQPEKNYHTWMVRTHVDGWRVPERFLLFDRYIITSMTEKGTIYCYSEVDSSGYQIYCSRLENGKYMKPEKLGAPFNGENIDAAPCISREG